MLLKRTLRVLLTVLTASASITASASDPSGR